MNRPSFIIILLALLSSFTGTLPAGEVWTGGGSNDNWSNGNNWFNLFAAVPPPNNGSANIVFPGTTRLTPNLDANWDIESLTFGGAAGAFIIETPNNSALTIRGGGITQNSAQTQTVNTRLILIDAQPWNVAAGTLAIGAQIAGSGRGDVTKSGAGLLILNHADNSFAGGLAIQGGRVDGETLTDAGINSSFGTGHFSLSGGGDLRWAGGISAASTASSNRNVTLGAGGGQVSTVTGGLHMSGLFSGTGGLTVDVNGGLRLNNTGNSFAGDVIVRAGNITGSSIANTGVNSSFGRANFYLAREGGIAYTGPTASTNRNVTLLDEGANVNVPPEISVTNPAATLTWNGLISGPGRLSAGGVGRLVLANPNNSFSDTLWIFGTVAGDTIANRLVNSSFGAGGNFFLFGTLSYTGPTASTDRNVTLGSSSAIDVADPATTLTMTGQFLGNQQSDQLTKTGPGKLLLPPIGFNGRVNVSGGTLSSSSVGGFGNASPSTTLSGGGILEYTGPTATLSRTVILGTGGGAINVANAASALTWNAFSLSGAGPFTKLGDGTLIMNVTNNTSTGGIVVASGALQGSASSLRGNIVNDAALVINQALDGTFSGNISGTGSFMKTGAGTLILAGANSYMGGTTVSAGVLQGSTATLAGNIVNNASVVFDQGFDGSYDGLLTGAGTVTKTGVGSVSLANSGNSFAGDLSILNGKVIGSTMTDFGTDSSFGRGNFLLDNGGILSFTGSSTASNRQLTLGTSGGAIEVADFAANLTLSGQISGPGSLTKIGAGTLTLDRANDYTGGTTVLAGRLRGSAGGLPRDIVNHAIVEFAQTTDGAYSGQLRGPGNLVKTGPGKVTIATPVVYTGTTTVSLGTLNLPNTLNTPGGAIQIQSAGVLEASGIIQRAISGAGALTATGNLVAGDITSASGFQAGAVNVGNHAVVLLDADRANIGGGTIAGGSVTSLAGLELTGATFSGHGTINGAFINNGTVAGPSAPQALSFAGPLSGAGSFTGSIRILDSFSPGNSPAAVTLEDVTFGPDSELTMELAGLIPDTEYDTLTVSGIANLDGVLNVTLDPAWLAGPQFGDRFDLVTAAVLQGSFNEVQLPALSGNLHWRLNPTTTSLTLTVIPEPKSLLLLLVACLALAAKFARRQT